MSEVPLLGGGRVLEFETPCTIPRAQNEVALLAVMKVSRGVMFLRFTLLGGLARIPGDLSGSRNQNIGNQMSPYRGTSLMKTQPPRTLP